MKTNSRTDCSGWALIEAVCALVIVVMLAFLIWACVHREKVEMPDAYQAWVKQTGNEKHLTYEEWRALIRANEQRDSTIILIPH